MQTRSAYMKSPWEFEVRTIDLPETPPPGWALVRIEACGICGTDLAAAESKAAKWQAFGHEIAGVIEHIEPGSHGLNRGDHVVLESSSYCGTCAICRNGRVDLCNKGANFWGQPAMGFGERMLAPVGCLVGYKDLPDHVACLAEPAGVAFDMIKTANINNGERVCIIGPGPIALMAIPLALRSGATRVTCIGKSRGRRRLEVAGLLGAEPIAHDGPLDSLVDLKQQFDHVLVTAPVQCIPEALSFLAYGGEMTYIGIGTGANTITFDANNFHFRKLQLRASFASPAIYYPRVLELLRTKVIPGDLIVSNRFPLAEISAAMNSCRDDKENVVKVVVTPEAR
jgi:L-iditol 2-dehydrogenase